MLRPVERRAGLAAGWYRFASADGRFETEFEVSGNEYRFRPALVEPAPWLEERWMRVPAGRHGSDDCTVDVGAFGITRDAVTWADVERVFETPEERAIIAFARGQQSPANRAPDQPALLPCAMAQAFASRVGARLPTSAEAWAAAQEPELARDLATYGGSWTSLRTGRECNALRHADVLAGASPLLEPFDPGNYTTEICFRLARSLPR